MTTKIKHIASNIITTAELNTSSLDSHFSGGTGVTYSGGAISIGQAVAASDSPTFADLTITGNLNITGNIDQYNVTDLDVTDKTITLGSGQIEANSGGSGIIIDGSSASLLWDETNTEWDFNNPINVSGEILVGNTSSRFAENNLRFKSSGAAYIDHNTTGQAIKFRTSNSSSLDTNAMTILGSGNVGIGTDSPTMPLSVQAASNAYAISMHGRSDGYSELYGASNDGSTKYSFLQSHSAQTKLYTLVNTPLLFGTNSTERMRLSEGGVLYIGSGHETSSPSDGIIAAAYASGYNNAGGDLELYGGRSTGDNGGGEIRFFTGAAGSPGTQINAHTRRMTIDSTGNLLIGPGTQAGNGDGNITISEGNAFAGFDFKSTRTAGNIGGTRFYNTSSDSVPKAQLLIETDGSYNFYNGSNGAQNRMKITSSGNVGIGTTSNPQARMHIVGTGQFDMLTIERTSSTPGVKFVSGADTAGTFGFQLMDNNEWWVGKYDGSNYDYWIQSSPNAVRVKKPISSFTDSGTKQYSHLCTGSFYQSTGYLVVHTNIPGHNQSGNANMLSFKIRGFEYAVFGAIDMNVGVYCGENSFYSASYNGTYVPEGWRDNVQMATDSNGKLALILGTSSTIQRIEMAVTDFIQGFISVNESYAEGWTITHETSLSGYSGNTYLEPRMSSPRPSFHAYLSASTSFVAGTYARILGSVEHNDGSHYNTSNGRFTAPTKGIYHFDMALQLNSSATTQTYVSAEIRVNAGTRYIGGWFEKTGTSYGAATGSVTLKLDRDDYVEFYAELSQTDTALGGLAGYTYLSGTQIG